MAKDPALRILLAEFDIDTGSQLSIAYPPLSDDADPSFFADMMLPEGMHLRENDWTVFFLTPTPRTTDTISGSSSSDSSSSSSSATAAAATASGDGGLTFCLNIAGRRLDRATRRGAHVKALALCTSHNFLVAFKQGLSQALELVFDSPTLETVKHIYDAFAAIDLRALPSLDRAQRCMLRPLVDAASGSATLRSDSTLSTSVRMRCPMPPADAGGEAAAAAAASAAEETAESAAAAAAAVHVAAAEERRSSAAALATAGLHAVIPIRIPLYLEPDDTGLTRAGGAVRKLLNCFGTSFIRIWEAVLLEKRVLFTAHKQAACEACEAVLALVSLFRPLHGCGILARAFPHATLSTMEHWLPVPGELIKNPSTLHTHNANNITLFLYVYITRSLAGYIAGVANPVFAERDSWWDVLADLNTHTITDASHVKEARKAEKLRERAATQVADADEASAARMRSAEKANALSEADAIDKELMTRVLSGVARGFDEEWIVSAFAAFTERHVIGMAFNEIEFRNDEEQYRLRVAATHSRVRSWTQTRSFDAYTRLRERRATAREEEQTGGESGVSAVDALRADIRKLYVVDSMTNADAVTFFNALEAALQSERDCQLLLLEVADHMPDPSGEHVGGVFPIAAGLLHDEARVRQSAVRLCDFQYRLRTI